VGGETIREPDGLAMSSRNGYLSKDDRVTAGQLNVELRKIKDAVEAGARTYDRLAAAARAALEAAGWQVDYVEIRSRSALAVATVHDAELVVLAAAWLGKTRLIDNMEITATL